MGGENSDWPRKQNVREQDTVTGVICGLWLRVVGCVLDGSLEGNCGLINRIMLFFWVAGSSVFSYWLVVLRWCLFAKFQENIVD